MSHQAERLKIDRIISEEEVKEAARLETLGDSAAFQVNIFYIYIGMTPLIISYFGATIGLSECPLLRRYA